METSDLLVGTAPDAVLPLGDIQYDSSSLANIMAVYDPSWGRVKAISHPILGNHESSGAGYFDYFNGPGAADGPAGSRGKGWYSFDVGSWHLIALNSNCTRPADTTTSWTAASGPSRSAGSGPIWRLTRPCTLAFWHHPRYSSGHDGSTPSRSRFGTRSRTPRPKSSCRAIATTTSASHRSIGTAPDPGDGIRQFVVGTGGAFFTGIGSTIANSEVSQNDTFGVLKLTLHPTSYDWQFVPEAGKTFTDSGSYVPWPARATPRSTPASGHDRPGHFKADSLATALQRRFTRRRR